MAKRTDIHTEANFVATDYEPIGYYYLGTPSSFTIGPNSNGEYETVINREYDVMRAWVKMVSRSTTTAYHNGARCDHCGANIAYVVVMLHRPSGDALAVGETCAAGRFIYSPEKFAAMRKNAAEARIAAKTANAWREFMAEYNTVDWSGLYGSTNGFVMDVLRKGRQYGSLSDRQVSAIVLAVVRDADAAKVAAEREATDAEKVREPAPRGRTTVKGFVVGMKAVDSIYGSTMKALVEDDRGFKVWVTCPVMRQFGEPTDEGYMYRSVDNKGRHYTEIAAQRGDRIEFSVDLTPSLDDPCFAWGKRPTKVTVTAVVTDAELAEVGA